MYTLLIMQLIIKFLRLGKKGIISKTPFEFSLYKNSWKLDLSEISWNPVVHCTGSEKVKISFSKKILPDKGFRFDY